MNLKKIMIGDHCIVTSSKRFHLSERVEVGIPFYRSKEIIQKFNGEVVSECDYIPIEEYVNIKEQFGAPRVGDLLLTTRGTYGVPYVYKEKDCFYFADGNITWFKDFDEQLNSKYLYYWFQSYEGYQKVDAIAKGTAQKAVPITTLKQLELYTPIIDLQNKIVDILSTYDNLIENNQKQIKLLEEATQRLYKEWFIDLRFPGYENVEIVDGIPEGWSKVSMDQIAEYINGYAFKPSDWSEFGKPIIKIKELNEGITKSTPRNDGSFIPDKYNISVGDIIFSWSATLTAKIWDAEDGLLNQHLFKVIPKKGISREYVLQSILNTLEWFRNLTTGSTMKHIQRGKLKEVFVCLPSNNIMNLYVKIAEPYRERLLKLNQQNIYLTEARDRLLPKLMSGEIEV